MSVFNSLRQISNDKGHVKEDCFPVAWQQYQDFWSWGFRYPCKG